MKRFLVAFAIASAVLLVGGLTAWAVFTDEQSIPQTISSGTWVTTPPDTSPPPPTGELAVQINRAPNDQGGHTPQISLRLVLVNRRATAVNLPEITIRYWFTDDGVSNLVTDCHHFAGGDCNRDVVRTFGTVSPTLPGADRYLEVGFTSTAGTLAAGAARDMDMAIREANYQGSFNVTDDWSYRALNPNLQTNAPCVTAYINGVLAWGHAPSNTPVAECP